MNKTQSEIPQLLVRAITPGTTIRTLLMVSEASRKEARNGPFWMLTLKDATGSLPARIWSPLSLHFEDIPSGSLVEVEGRAERYREQTQLSVTALRVLPPEEVAGMDTSAFMPSTARSPLLMLEELEALADAVLTHAPWHTFVRSFLRDEDVFPRLIKAPAARGIHHARVGGLLEHTLGVTRVCLHFAELYPQLDRQALFVGAVCHDLGKLWELTLDFNTEYTDEGRLAGHIFLGLEKMRPHLQAAGLEPDLVLHLQHLILSHHGEYEYGSPRLPQTAEALALHYADNVDAKMDQCRNLFTDMAPEEGAWAPFQKTLNRAVYRAPRTPENAPRPDDSSPEKPENSPENITESCPDQELDGPPPDDFYDEPPVDDFCDEPPADDEPEAPGEECVFEHVTSAAYIDTVVASARIETAQAQADITPDIQADISANFADADFAGDVPGDDVPTEDVPTDDVPTDDVPADDVPADEPASALTEADPAPLSVDEGEAFFFLSGTDDTPARFAFEALPESPAASFAEPFAEPFAEEPAESFAELLAQADAPLAGAIADPFADLPDMPEISVANEAPANEIPAPEASAPAQSEAAQTMPAQPTPAQAEKTAEAVADATRADKPRQEKRTEARQCSLL